MINITVSVNVKMKRKEFSYITNVMRAHWAALAVEVPWFSVLGP